MNMLPPPELEACTAPEPVDESICVITGRAAKYRDPDTNLPYADVGAYQELQLRLRQGAARSLKKQHANNASRKPKQESSGEALLQESCGLQACYLHLLQLPKSRFGIDGKHDGLSRSQHAFGLIRIALYGAIWFTYPSMPERTLRYLTQESQ